MKQAIQHKSIVIYVFSRLDNGRDGAKRFRTIPTTK